MPFSGEAEPTRESTRRALPELNGRVRNLYADFGRPMYRDPESTTICRSAAACSACVHAAVTSQLRIASLTPSQISFRKPQLGRRKRRSRIPASPDACSGSPNRRVPALLRFLAAYPRITIAPVMAIAAPTASSTWAAALRPPTATSATRHVDAAVRGVRAARKGGINARQDDGKCNQTRDTHDGGPRAHPPPQPEPKRKTACDFEEGGQAEGGKVRSHASNSADKNSRVPDGPVRSSTIGPPSGSTVMVNPRNRQHCRSASTVRAISESASSDANRSRWPSLNSSRDSTRWISSERTRTAGLQGCRRQCTHDGQLGHRDLLP